MKGRVDLAAELSVRGVALRSLTDGIDAATHTGRLVFPILGSIARMERELIQNAGRRGWPQDAAEAGGVSVSTFYRHFPPAAGVCRVTNSADRDVPFVSDIYDLAVQ